MICQSKFQKEGILDLQKEQVQNANVCKPALKKLMTTRE